MIDGLPFTIPPSYLDPDRTPLRNTLRQAIDHIRHAARQLMLHPLTT